MRPFAYERAGDARRSPPGAPTGQGETDAPVQFLAGGTTLLDLMKLDVLRPDAGGRHQRRWRRDHAEIEVGPGRPAPGRLRRTCRPSPTHPAVQARLSGHRPVADAGGQPAAAQHGHARRQRAAAHPLPLLSRSELGGLQQAQPGLRLRGDRAASTASTPCWASSDKCIAQYPGDFAVALVGAGGRGRGGRSRRARGASPFARSAPPVAASRTWRHTLRPGEVITAFRVPAGPLDPPLALSEGPRPRSPTSSPSPRRRSALDLDGGVGPRRRASAWAAWPIGPGARRRPRRALVGKPLTEETADAAGRRGAGRARVTHGHNDYKPELGRRTLVRALMQAAQPWRSEHGLRRTRSRATRSAASRTAHRRRRQGHRRGPLRLRRAGRQSGLRLSGHHRASPAAASRASTSTRPAPCRAFSTSSPTRTSAARSSRRRPSAARTARPPPWRATASGTTARSSPSCVAETFEAAREAAHKVEVAMRRRRRRATFDSPGVETEPHKSREAQRRPQEGRRRRRLRRRAGQDRRAAIRPRPSTTTRSSCSPPPASGMARS